jgi:HEAT repeat protein
VALNLFQDILSFTQDGSPEVRSQALRVLAFSQRQDAVPILLNALFADPTDNVRYQVALWLGRFKTVEAADGLIKALTDGNSEVRRAATRALAVHGNHQAIPVLKTVAKNDKIREVRIAANEAIENIQRGTW